ncbi:MAG: primosomal protein N' [Polyangiales bacterium]
MAPHPDPQQQLLIESIESTLPVSPLAPDDSNFEEARCADVAVPLPIDKPFTYRVPEHLAPQVVAGARVLVPFGGRRLLGVVIEVRSRKIDGKIKPILDVVDATPVLPQELLSFLREVARYYFAPLGEVLSLALPAIERRAVTRMRERGLDAAVGSKIAPNRMIRWVKFQKSFLASTAGEANEGVDVSPHAAAASSASNSSNVLNASNASTAKVASISPRWSAAAKSMMERLEREGEVSVRALTEQWPTAAAIAKKLAAAGLVMIEEREVVRSSFAEPEARDTPPALTLEQRDAVDAIVAAVDHASSALAHAEKSAPPSFLLHGVTGSGKTEVYLHAIAATLQLGRGALVLVPEIALTPQLVGRFRARFGDEVAVVHSALDPSSRHAMWRRLHNGELRVAIGARSALFAPVPDLGLIVVDEEHDPSFKQEEGVRYHARDCALLRAHRANAVCVLGSATPSLEAVDLANRGTLIKKRLLHRARAQALPAVTIIDLRHVGPGPTGSKLLSLPLHRALEATLLAREQTILFLNRRGFAPAIICESCGELRRCNDCDVALTLHRKSATRLLRGGGMQTIPEGLRCHYCDHVEALPPRCPKCGGPLAQEGNGTERLEQVLTAAFPSARVARLDRDVASGKDVETILKKVRAREVDILVGTQMVTKGHDLPHVTLVGVINADSALSMPDFRAAERTFQLLVQVAGRAGRGDAKGTVMVQTRSPDHPAIVCAADHDVDAFLTRELQDRAELDYPPFSRLVMVRLDGLDELKTAQAGDRLAKVAQQTEEVRRELVDVRGPAPAPLPRIRGRFRYRVLLRGPRAEVRAVARVVKRETESIGREVRVVIDVDPLSMM